MQANDYSVTVLVGKNECEMENCMCEKSIAGKVKNSWQRVKASGIYGDDVEIVRYDLIIPHFNPTEWIVYKTIRRYYYSREADTEYFDEERFFTPYTYEYKFIEDNGEESPEAAAVSWDDHVDVDIDNL